MTGNAAQRPMAALPSALGAAAEIMRMADGRRVVLFLDFDGTLTPIVERPELVRLSPRMRAVLDRTAERLTVAIVTGRDVTAVRDLISIDGLYYAGSHGFDIQGPAGFHRAEAAGVAAEGQLIEAERRLAEAARAVPGALVERKRFSVALHTRLVSDPDTVRALERVVDDTVSALGNLRKTHGKRVFEIRPDVDWDKGRAVLWIVEALGCEGKETLPIYIGDDLTDEDAFAALAGRGIGIVVRGRDGPRAAGPDRSTHARYALADVAEVGRFLARLAEAVR